MLIQRNIFRILLAIALNTALLVGTLHAQTIAGKIVGVADGDTITVLQDRTQYKSGCMALTPQREARTLAKGSRDISPQMAYNGRQTLACVHFGKLCFYKRARSRTRARLITYHNFQLAISLCDNN